MLRQILFVLLLSSTLAAQCDSKQAASPAPNRQSQTQSAAQLSSTEPNDDLARMRNDLNQMESLLNNMSSEITFLRDQNLQILLNTNARMWTILIRDLRQQIEREERRQSGRLAPSQAQPANSQPKPQR